MGIVTIRIGKIKSIMKLYSTHQSRNMRDNIMKISINHFNIMKIPYYQKNPTIISTLLDKKPCMIGCVPEEMIKLATTRSQEIQNAYEMIRKSRPALR